MTYGPFTGTAAPNEPGHAPGNNLSALTLPVSLILLLTLRDSLVTGHGR